MSKDEISKAIKDAVEAYGQALDAWYPQHGDNAPSERNLTLYLAQKLKEHFPTMHFYAEASHLNHGKARARIDLVGYEPHEKSAVVVEAKRVLKKSPVGLLADFDRVESFELSNDNHTHKEVAKFGLLVTQTTEKTWIDWWKTAASSEPTRRDLTNWDNLRAQLAFIASCKKGVVDMKKARSHLDLKGNKVDRYVLWALWPSPIGHAPTEE